MEGYFFTKLIMFQNAITYDWAINELLITHFMTILCTSSLYFHILKGIYGNCSDVVIPLEEIQVQFTEPATSA